MVLKKNRLFPSRRNVISKRQIDDAQMHGLAAEICNRTQTVTANGLFLKLLELT